ncbi:MAG: prenyltransferase [Dehalococcoidales bacterium]|nr:prenyltransferase [Dehalococcoidales bacterium]
MKFKGFMMIARGPFLLLALILGFLGASVAWYESQEFGGDFNLGYAFLTGFGLIVAHISVNVWNEYFDYRSKIDFKTRKTPFSGGSGAIPSGIVTPGQALWLGIISLIIIIPIGIFFTVVKGWLLLPLLVIAIGCILLYTPFILKIGYPEWAAGLGLGLLPILGAYFVHTGEYTFSALIASVPSGLLVHNLLLLNEFPDVEADKTGNRRTLPIFIGKKRAAIFYSVTTVIVYLWIIATVITGDMPVFTLLGLLTFPLAFRAIEGAFKYDDMSKFVPAQANNVLVVLLTQLLIGIGYILGGVF